MWLHEHLFFDLIRGEPWLFGCLVRSLCRRPGIATGHALRSQGQRGGLDHRHPRRASPGRGVTQTHEPITPPHEYACPRPTMYPSPWQALAPPPWTHHGDDILIRSRASSDPHETMHCNVQPCASLRLETQSTLPPSLVSLLPPLHALSRRCHCAAARAAAFAMGVPHPVIHCPHRSSIGQALLVTGH